MADQTIQGSGGASDLWHIVTPDDVQVTDIPASGSNSGLHLEFDYTATDYTNGSPSLSPLTVHFIAPDPPASVPGSVPASFGLAEDDVTIDIHNALGEQIDEYQLTLTNDAPVAPADTSDFHPDNYAHFHNTAPSTFGGSSITQFDPNNATTPGDPPGVAPNRILVDQQIAPSTDVDTTGFVIHSEEAVASVRATNSFTLSFEPTAIAGGSYTSLVLNEVPTVGAVSSESVFSPLASVTVTDTVGSASITAIIQLNGLNAPTGTYVNGSLSGHDVVSVAPVDGLTTYEIAAEGADQMAADLQAMVFTASGVDDITDVMQIALSDNYGNSAFNQMNIITTGLGSTIPSGVTLPGGGTLSGGGSVPTISLDPGGMSVIVTVPSVITQSAGSNTVNSNVGSLTVTATGGSLTLFETKGGDIINEAPQTLFVAAGESATSTIIGASGGSDTIFAGGGLNYQGTSSSNSLLVGSAEFVSVASAANEVIFGGTGGGVYTPGSTDFFFFGGGAADTITGNGASPTVWGNSSENVVLNGTSGKGVFIAFGESDTINAAASGGSNSFIAVDQALTVPGGNFSGNTTLVGSSAGGDTFGIFLEGTGGSPHTITIENWQATDTLFLGGYSSDDIQGFDIILYSSPPGGGASYTLADKSVITFIGQHPTSVNS